VKLKHLDSYINARRRLADSYDAAFKAHPKLITPYRAQWCKHVFHQYTLVLDGIDRNELHAYLADLKIPSMIYYPVPAHRQKMFAQFNSSSTDLPNTDWLTERVISLPMHTEMDEEQINFITSSVLNHINQ
jgi:UDP-2-acetamido-2-deoxy-ribo-hexuluronate aminotransferase